MKTLCSILYLSLGIHPQIGNGIGFALQVPGAGDMSVRSAVYIGALPGGAGGVAEAVRLAPHPPQAAEGKHAMFRELHGVSDRKMDEFLVARESGKSAPHVSKYNGGNAVCWL